MLLLWFALWVMAAILYFSDRKNERTRWGSILAFFGGCGGLGTVINEDARSYFRILEVSPEFMQGVNLTYALFASLSYFMAPYALIIFSIVDHGAARKSRPYFKAVLLLPPLTMFFLYPMYPKFQPDYSVLSVWVVPYVVIANLILLYSCLKERNFVIKRQKLITMLVVTPTTFFALCTLYVMQSLDMSQAWRHNTWIISLGFIGFLYFSLNFGFMGVRLRLEKQRFDISVKAATSGTAILNHTIKNEIGKISILANELMVNKELPELPEAYRRNIDWILQSSQHVLSMAKRIHYSLNVMEMQESVFRLKDVLENSLKMLQHDLHRIQVIKEFGEIDRYILGDPVHLQETLINCIKNSIEAIVPGEGIISLRLYESSNQLCIEVKDNGKGIKSEDIPYVLDPFHSTKMTAGNYGLGLTYCYSVMQKHGGNLILKSKGVNRGTVVTLSLPSKRIQKRLAGTETRGSAFLAKEVSYGGRGID